jgi:hypothetical protein
LFIAVAALSACKGGSAEPEPTPSPQPAASIPSPAAAPAQQAAPGHGSPAQSAPSAFDPAHPEVAGVRFTAPEPFVYRRPNTGMRAAEYIVAGGEGEKPAVLAIHHFPGMGGSLDANIDRWVGQFTQPDGRSSKDVAKIEQANINGLAVLRVDVSGTFGGGMQMPGAPSAAPEPNQRLLGAIVTGPNGPVFFKLVGSAGSVERVAPAFSKLLASVAPAK